MDEPQGGRSRPVFPVISIVTFIGFLDTTLLIPVMSDYARELGAGVGIAGLVIGLYSIVNTPANILFGRLIDRVGYRLPLIGGLAGDAAAMFLYALCRTPLHLGLTRVFHGLTGAVVGPATMSAIVVHSAEERKGRAMSIYGMSIAAATLIGSALGGTLASKAGFNALFYLGTGLLATGFAASFLLPGAAKPATRLPSSIRPVKGLLKRPGLLVAYAAIFAQYFGFGGVVTLLLYHISDYGMDRFHMGMFMAVFAALFIIVQFYSGSLSDRRGRRLPVISGLLLGIVSLLLLPSQTAFVPLLVIMALYGTAYGLLFPSVSALVADSSRPEERGVATGIFHALLTAGVAIGAPVMGAAGELVGVRTAMLLTPVAMVIALVITLVLLRDESSKVRAA